MEFRHKTPRLPDAMTPWQPGYVAEGVLGPDEDNPARITNARTAIIKLRRAAVYGLGQGKVSKQAGNNALIMASNVPSPCHVAATLARCILMLRAMARPRSTGTALPINRPNPLKLGSPPLGMNS